MTRPHGGPAPSVTLIITATVDPRPVPALVLTRADRRADEYRDALRFWMRKSNLFHRIEWWENSNHKLARQIAADFAPLVHPNVFRAEPFDSHRGKGYGEALMLEKIASAVTGSDYVLKCTGRLSVANISSLL